MILYIILSIRLFSGDDDSGKGGESKEDGHGNGQMKENLLGSAAGIHRARIGSAESASEARIASLKKNEDDQEDRQHHLSPG